MWCNRDRSHLYSIYHCGYCGKTWKKISSPPLGYEECVLCSKKIPAQYFVGDHNKYFHFIKYLITIDDFSFRKLSQSIIDEISKRILFMNIHIDHRIIIYIPYDCCALCGKINK